MTERDLDTLSRLRSRLQWRLSAAREQAESATLPDTRTRARGKCQAYRAAIRIIEGAMK